MNLRGFLLLILLPLLSLFACGGGDTFRVNGKVEGMMTQNLFAIYYGDGSYKSTRTAALDGKFLFEGRSRDWTTVYFFNNQHSLVGFVVIKNGETVNANFKPGNISATEMDGNKFSKELTQWIKENATALSENKEEEINEAVSKFVQKNPESFLSSVLLLNFYHPQKNNDEADRLFRMIDPKARPAYLTEGWIERIEIAGDSTNLLVPDSLEMIDVNDTLHVLPLHKNMTVIYVPASLERNVEIDKAIRRLIKNDSIVKSGYNFYEINTLVMDTTEWKKAVRNDSLPWKRFWHPMTPQFLLKEKLPVVILSDTTGSVLYRGNSINSVINILETQN